MPGKVITSNRMRLIVVTIVGTVLTLGCAGLGALLAGDGRALVTFVVYAVVMAPLWYCTALILISNPEQEDPVTHREETAEYEWMRKAMAGAFGDVMIAMGLSTALLSMLGAPSVPTVVFIGLGMVSSALRYWAVSRRAA